MLKLSPGTSASLTHFNPLWLPPTTPLLSRRPQQSPMGAGLVSLSRAHLSSPPSWPFGYQPGLVSADGQPCEGGGSSSFLRRQESAVSSRQGPSGQWDRLCKALTLWFPLPPLFFFFLSAGGNFIYSFNKLVVGSLLC